MPRIQSLDILRGMAIFLVLIWHWMPENSWLNFLFNGKLGVNLFFVLSGYLISKGLFESKEKNIRSQLFHFYWKRFFRIFPIYYLLLFILLYIDYDGFRELQHWYWLYGTNVLFEKTGQVLPYTIHFWSLGVEEQFYIFWPLLFLFFCKIKKHYISFLLGMIVLSLLFHWFNSNVQKVYWLNSFLYFFSFAVGALLVFFPVRFKGKKSLLLLSISFLLLLVITFLVRKNQIQTSWIHFSLDTSYSLFSLSLLIVFLQSESFFERLKSLFKPIVFMGKISYGVYLYHYFMYPLNHFLHQYALEHELYLPFSSVPLFPEFGNPYVRFIYFLILTLIISIFSFYIIEKPILNLSAKMNKR